MKVSLPSKVQNTKQPPLPEKSRTAVRQHSPLQVMKTFTQSFGSTDISVQQIMVVHNLTIADKADSSSKRSAPRNR